MPTIRQTFSEGSCTSRDRGALKAGQLQQTTGCLYRPGDTERLYKILGRSAFGTVSAGQNVKSLALCQFDAAAAGVDALLMYERTSIYASAPGVLGTPATTNLSPALTGLNAAATKLSVAHDHNRFYLANGYDPNKVVETAATFPLPTRQMGMQAPQVQPTAVAAAATVTATPRATADADTGPLTWRDRSFARDASGLLTYARATATVATGTAYVATWHTWGSDTAAARSLNVIFAVAGFQIPTGQPRGGESHDVGTGGTFDLGAEVNIKIEYSVNSGGAFTTLFERTGLTTTLPRQSVQIPVTANSNVVHVRATMTYVSGSSPATFRIYDILLQTAAIAIFSTLTGLYYAVTEYDSVRGLESPSSPASAIVTLTNQNVVTLTLPNNAGTAEPRNLNATHWRIYRTTDGGAVPAGLSLMASIPIAQTTWLDLFNPYDKDTPGEELYALVAVTDGRGTRYFPRDAPPPIFSHLNAFRGGLIGISRDKPRSLFYSWAGRPESWPEIYVIENFPMPERGQLLASVTVGDTLIVAADTTMMAMNDVPRETSAIFNTTDLRPLRGQPGVVNADAICAFSVVGEPLAAWVSRFGVHVTNGTTSRRISGGMNWTVDPAFSAANLDTAVLFWDQSLLCLVLAYDSDADGFNDRWILFHMAPEHQTEDGPKWTGPHYGAIQAMAAGQVAKVYRRWSGHPTAGIVYNENLGSTDASAAYSSTQVPMIVKGPRQYAEGSDYAVVKANLRHTDFGVGSTAAVTWAAGRDSWVGTESQTATPSMASQLGTEFYVGRSGEWHEWTITHTGAATAGAALLDLRLTLLGQAASGRVA